jgi:hypothetical protein
MSQHQTTPRRKSLVDGRPVNRNACQRVSAKNPLLAAARYYALQLGGAVFPLRPGGKTPITPQGFKDATNRELDICRWWKDEPAANVGMPMGEASGLFALDVDPRHGGLETLAALQREYGELPPTRMARTGGGGFHLYFRWQPGLGNTTGRLGPGLDTRGEGGYVVLPPSVLASGGRYEWMNELEPAEPPAWLLELLAKPLRPPSRPGGVVRSVGEAAEAFVEGAQDSDPRRSRAAETLIGRASGLAEGERNSGAFKLAAALREVAATEEVWDAYKARLLRVLPYGPSANGGPPFTESEAERTIASAETRAALGAWVPTMTLTEAGRTAAQDGQGGTERGPHPEPERGLRVQWSTDIKVAPLQWLWRGYVPLGALGVLAGPPKVGKSAVAVDLAARVTSGRPMPDGTPGVQGRVLMVAPEDGGDGARVRFLAAGGAEVGDDGKRTFGVLWEDLEDSDAQVPPTFPDRTAELERAIRANDVRLMVIDNLDAVAGRKLEMNKAKDVTEMLAPLQAVAKRTGAAILAIEHTRKGGASDPLDAVLGSRKVTGVARFVAFVVRDQDDPKERLFGVRGNYTAEDDGTLRFTAAHDGSEDARRISLEWQGASGVSLQDAVRADGEGQGGALGEAVSWLRDYLKGGGRERKEIVAEAKEMDISDWALKEARRRLGIVPERLEHEQGRPTVWELPATERGHDVSGGGPEAQGPPETRPPERIGALTLDFAAGDDVSGGLMVDHPKPSEGGQATTERDGDAGRPEPAPGSMWAANAGAETFMDRWKNRLRLAVCTCGEKHEQEFSEPTLDHAKCERGAPFKWADEPPDTEMETS